MSSIVSTLAVISDFAGLKSAMGSVMGILVMFSYLAAVVFLITGIMKKDNDPGAAAASMKTAAWLAAAPTVITILFYVFGQSSATVTATY